MVLSRYGRMILIALIWALPANGAVVRQPNNLRSHNANSTLALGRQALGTPGKAVLQFVEELEYELHGAKTPPMKNKVVLVLLTGIFGLCGVDRCYMNQLLCGVAKGLTLGGCGVWMFVDMVLIFINTFMMETFIDTLGFKAGFLPDTVSPAFYVMWAVLVWQIVTHVLCSKVDSKKYRKKAADHVAARMPTPFTASLRRGGLLSERPGWNEVVATFKNIDKDGSGELDYEEMKEALNAMGTPEDEAKNIMELADKNKDGKISINEFLAAVYPECCEDPVEEERPVKASPRKLEDPSNHSFV